MVVRFALHLTDCKSGFPPSLMLAPPSMREPGYFHCSRVSRRLIARSGFLSWADVRAAVVSARTANADSGEDRQVHPLSRESEEIPSHGRTPFADWREDGDRLSYFMIDE